MILDYHVCYAVCLSFGMPAIILYYEYEFYGCSLQNCKSINTLSHKEVIGGQFPYQPR